MEKGGGGVGDVGSLLAALPSVKRYSGSDIYNACVRGKQEELQKMLKQSRLDVNWAEPQYGHTTVHVAAAYGHDKCLSMIIQYGGAHLSKTVKGGWAPIHAACNHGRIACLILLLDNGVDADLPTVDKVGATSTYLCCQMGHVKCLALLLDRGANPDLASKSGLTPILVACYGGRYKCVQLLIARGADFNASNAQGITPLDVAKSRGHQECVELLLENGAVGKSDVALRSQTKAEKVASLV
jgi:ankyrin repeat protein